MFRSKTQFFVVALLLTLALTLGVSQSQACWRCGGGGWGGYYDGWYSPWTTLVRRLWLRLWLWLGRLGWLAPRLATRLLWLVPPLAGDAAAARWLTAVAAVRSPTVAAAAR